MKRWLICAFIGLHVTQAAAQACWNEAQYLGQRVIRAGQCSENISDRDFERLLCKVHVEGDTLRTARSCPAEVNAREGAQVVVQPIVAKCLGFRPGMAEGVHNTYYYDGASFKDSRDNLRSRCVGYAGTWVEETK